MSRMVGVGIQDLALASLVTALGAWIAERTQAPPVDQAGARCSSSDCYIPRQQIFSEPAEVERDLGPAIFKTVTL